MKKMTSQQIRETWLNFFKERGHMVEPGASLIPQNDPTLLWINAGVAALKKYFDGSEIPECKRITNVQKCIRTNDISNVGKTARHHTFFEMLGNFSIGDYFRKEIIEWAFDLLTNDKYFGMDKNKLYVTYHPNDLETRELWIKQGMDETHLIPLEGNFWQIGEGPCGPNTEVFFDRGEQYDPNKLGVKLLEDDIENDRYIEIWGIVFSQFNAENGVKRENYKELPHKNIDTGAGLERIACILQETETNFETDLFLPYIEELEKICHKPYDGKFLTPYRVIIDHIRTCVFALADGEKFSNEGRGYVLRRLLRRAMRYGQKLDLYEPFMYKLVDVVVRNMNSFYPYLNDKKEQIKNLILNEENQFLKTLVKGEKILNSKIENSNHLSGEDAFQLYDTFGFPIELTIEICSDSNVSVDVETFNKLLQKQKEQAKSSRKVLESFKKQSKDLLDFNEKSEFVYDKEDIDTTVIGLFIDGNKVNEIDNEGEIVLQKTNFYSEMGGEVSDTGRFISKNSEGVILDVLKCPNGQHLHKIKLNKGVLKLNDKVTLKLDVIKRKQIEKNHSATHLLQSALIKVLGDSVKQKGSYVDDKILRFDFSYPHKVDEKDLKEVELLVNNFIKEGIPSDIKILPIEEANKLDAISEFNEKYGKEVRVVSFGNISKEFCGGCHVKNSSDIGIFMIQNESAIASGVRRIQALTGFNVYQYLNLMKEKENKVVELLNIKSFDEANNKINSILNENEKLKIENENYLKNSSKNIAKELISKLNENKKIALYLKNTAKSQLNLIYDEVKIKFDDFIIVLIGEENGKYPVIVGVGSKLLNDYSAKDIIKNVTNILGGKGGGRNDFAQGNIVDPSKISSIKF